MMPYLGMKSSHTCFKHVLRHEQEAAACRHLTAAASSVLHRQATLQLLEASVAAASSRKEVWCQQKEASEHEPACCRYLTATDFTECHGRQATLKRIQLLEASVAAAVGVSMVYSSSALRAKPEYYRCCTRIVPASML